MTKLGFLRLSYEKQDTLLKLLILSMAAVLCKSIIPPNPEPVHSLEADREPAKPPSRRAPQSHSAPFPQLFPPGFSPS